MLFKSFASRTKKCHLISAEITCPNCLTKCTGCKNPNYFPTFLHLTLFSHKSSEFAHVAALFPPLIGWDWRHVTNERRDIPQVRSPRPQSLTGSQARRAQPSDIKWALRVMSSVDRYRDVLRSIGCWHCIGDCLFNTVSLQGGSLAARDTSCTTTINGSL